MALTFTRTAIAARPAAVPSEPARAELVMEKDTSEKEPDAITTAKAKTDEMRGETRGNHIHIRELEAKFPGN